MEKTERSAQKAVKPTGHEKLEKLRKTVIIVGASSGIGYETALRLLGRGFAVINISRTPCSLKKILNFTADIAAGDTLEKAIKDAAAANRQSIWTRILCGLFYGGSH